MNEKLFGNLVDCAFEAYGRNQKQVTELEQEYKKLEMAIEKVPAELEKLDAADWMPDTQKKVERDSITRQLERNKDRRYRVGLKKATAEAVFTTAINNFRTAEMYLERVSTSKMPW
jgi:hypothetical protein